MWVTWMSFEEKAHFAANATVQYGTKPHVLSLTATGTSTFFQNGNRTSFVHRVLLDNLKPSTEYCKESTAVEMFILIYSKTFLTFFL